MLSALTSDFVVETAAPIAGVSVRKAHMPDIGPILELINGYAARGIMLPRTEFEMSENIRDFMVVRVGGELAGCAALHFYSPKVAEVRSLAVDERWKVHGLGRKLVGALLDEAREFDLDAVFAFTYVPDFFAKLGFERVERGVLPLKAWKDCLRCPKFSCCDEIAMVNVLNPDHWAESQAHVSPDVFAMLPVVAG